MNPTVVEIGNGSKTLNTVSCNRCNNGSSANMAEFLDHFNHAHGHEFANIKENLENNPENETC